MGRTTSLSIFLLYLLRFATGNGEGKLSSSKLVIVQNNKNDPFLKATTNNILQRNGQTTFSSSSSSSLSPWVDAARNTKYTPELVIFGLRGGGSSNSRYGLLVHSFLQALDVFGTGVFAFSGALKAGKKGMDILGMAIIATITAVGGGTIRDVLMGCPTPGGVFWMREPLYLEICCWVAIATFAFWPILEKEFGWKDSALIVCISDALGLAAFGVIGAQKAMERQLQPILWVASGLMTSTFGGIVRDTICGEPPRVMYPKRTMYGTGPVMGSLVYTLLMTRRMMDKDSVAAISFLVIFAVRIISFNYKSWRLPHWSEGNR